MAEATRNGRRRVICGALLGMLLAAATHAGAQALPVAVKTMDISAFGGFQYSKPDFGTNNNTGGTVGVNVTRYIHLPIAPSLEARGNYATGNTITEKSVVAGLRGQYDFREHYHPYADFLFGGGSLRYDHNLGPQYHPDRGTVLSFGAGVDIDVVKHIQAKVDIQSQHWNLGPNSVTKPQGGDYVLSPLLVVVGVAYRVPFRPRNHQ